MAEAFARHWGAGKIEAFSAGSRPSGRVNPKAKKAMAELGIDLGAHDSKSLDDIPDIAYDWVVTMGCGDDCPAIKARHRDDWPLTDPAALPPERFNEVRDEIAGRVQALLTAIAGLSFETTPVPGGHERIYQAGLEDTARLSALGIQTARTWFADVYTDAELRAFIERDFSVAVLRKQLADSEAMTFLLHEVAGELLGFARINWAQPVPLEGGHGAELQKIYYLPKCTGRGLGRRMMAAVIDTVAARGVRTLWLDVLGSNPRALAFYEQLGFVRVGELPFATDRGAIGMVVLKRSLI